MDQQNFLGYFLDKNQRVLSLMGPSGTGKSFSADFLQEYLDYKVAKQLTTRDPRPDDKHYRYIGRDEFVRMEERGKILGIFSGNRETLDGNGYGYFVEEVMDQLSIDKKLILFSSAYELEQPDFRKKYGTSDKIGLGFKDPQSVVRRAVQCGKVMTPKEIMSRVEVGSTLTRIMEKYERLGDPTFNLIYSDAFDSDLQVSKARQISKIISCIGDNAENYENCIEEYISR